MGVVSVSSMTEPFLPAPLLSTKLVSDAFDCRLEGNCIGTDLDAGGGIDTLCRSILLPPVSGSEERAFLLAGEEPLPEARS